MNPQTQALQKNEAKRDIRSLIQSDSVKAQMALVLPKHLTADRMARVACTSIMRAPLLLECTPESLLDCLMRCSQYGLEPDGRRAHLIPYKNHSKGTVECTLIIDWKGLAELILRSGTISKIHADLICDKDEFAYDLGDVLHHRINFREARGEPYAAWAMAVTKTGEKFVQVMTKAEIEAIRDNSQGWRAFKAGYAKQSPWQDSPGEMWKKTVFRRLSKWLPLSPEIRDATESDDEPIASTVNTDILPPLPPEEPVKFISAPLGEVVGGDPVIPTPAPEKKRGKKVDPAPVESTPVAAPEPVTETSSTPEKTFEQTVDGEAEAGPSPLISAMDSAGVTVEQLLAFYNKNKGTDLKSLNEIPEASREKLIAILAKGPDSAQVKGMKG